MQNDNRLGKIAVFFRDDVIRSFAGAQDDRGSAQDDRALRMTGVALWRQGRSGDRGALDDRGRSG